MVDRLERVSAQPVAGLTAVAMRLMHPTEERASLLYEQQRDAMALRRRAEYLKNGQSLPVLAPWWDCPALAYWSGQPAVAGTSHESMPGIVDTARFYITTDYEDAEKILRARGVQRVVAYDSDRVLQDVIGAARPAAATGQIACRGALHASAFGAAVF